MPCSACSSRLAPLLVPRALQSAPAVLEPCVSVCRDVLRRNGGEVGGEAIEERIRLARHVCVPVRVCRQVCARREGLSV